MNLFLCELCLARTVGVLSARAEWLSTHVNANFDAKYRLGPGPPTLHRPATCQCWAFLYPTLPPSAQLMCINKQRKQNRCILTIWGSNNVSVCNVYSIPVIPCKWGGLSGDEQCETQLHSCSQTRAKCVTIWSCDIQHFQYNNFPLLQMF